MLCTDTKCSVNHKEVMEEKLLHVSKGATYELPEVDWELAGAGAIQIPSAQIHETKAGPLPDLDSTERGVPNTVIARAPPTCQLTIWCLCQGTDRQRTSGCPEGLSSLCSQCLMWPSWLLIVHSPITGPGTMSCFYGPALQALGSSATLKLDSSTYRNPSLTLS